MLQQTQVARVMPKWTAFVDAYPTPEECARAPLADVLRHWHGLGYPRRARNLHQAAAEVWARGSFPDTLEGLLALPGVGAYTARAVRAFAFEHPAAVVDTNIARVYARVAGRTLTAREVQCAADAALDGRPPWLWNQCLMDLGAALCRPVDPSCAQCPVRPACAWAGGGPDPAVGSAGVSRSQARFDGSDRQARGLLMAALQHRDVAVGDAGAVMRRPTARALTLVGNLQDEGLVRVVDGWISLG